MGRGFILAMVFAIAGVAAARAQHGPGSPPDRHAPYAAYEFLIGDWIATEGTATLRQSFSWGPGRSYIRYSTYSRPKGGEERLHFDGIMAWNGRSKALDFLIVVEPGSGVQERGTVTAKADGSIIRDVELTASDGSISRFRQTIRRLGSDTVVTSLMRRSGERWQPNFPGAERIEMKRVPR